MQRVSFIFLWLAIFLIPTRHSYSNNERIEIPVRSNGFSLFEENGKVGLKDEKGRILIPANHDAIGWSNGKTLPFENVIGYKSGALWGLISLSNKVVTQPEFIELVPGEGSLLVASKKSSLSQRSAFGSLSTSGKTVIPFIYDGLRIAHMRAVVMSRENTKFRYGLIDLDNNILIPIIHQRIYALGSLRYAVQNFENKVAIFSDEGKQVTGFVIDSLSSFKMDYAIIYQNKRQGLINRHGEIKVEPLYRNVQVDDKGKVKVRQTNTWIFLDGQNSRLGTYNADSIIPLSKNNYALSVSNSIQLTNNDMQPLHEGYFTSVSQFDDGKSVYRSSGKFGLIDSNGKILIPAKYNELIPARHFLIASFDSRSKTRWGILDSAGNSITTKNYEAIGAFNGKFFPVRNRNFWGAVSAAGKEIIACVHDSLVQQNGNHVVVKFKGEFGIINLREEWIVTPRKNRIQMLDDERFFEYAGKTTFLKSLDGNIIYFSDNPLQFKNTHVLEVLASGAFWIIDLNGIIIDRSYQPDNTDKIFSESEGLRAIYKDGKYGFIDNRGRLRIANRYEGARAFSDGFAAIKIRGKWGFIDQEENLVIQPVFDAVEEFHDGFAIVSQNKLTGIIHTNGKVILPLRYDDIRHSEQGRYVLTQNNLVGMADSRGNVIIHPKYDRITDTGTGYLIVQRNGKFGIVSLDGVSTVPMIYDGLYFDHHHRHFMAVKKSAWEEITL
jgi:hypothetical protein